MASVRTTLKLMFVPHKPRRIIMCACQDVVFQSSHLVQLIVTDNTGLSLLYSQSRARNFPFKNLVRRKLTRTSETYVNTPKFH